MLNVNQFSVISIDLEMDGEKFIFEDLFTQDMTKSEMINVFLALLDLLKLQTIRVEQSSNFGQINIISNEVN